jgi:iron(II)-dependent oxidoreductase
MDLSSPGYSSAEALRHGGRQCVHDALLAARLRTLALADAFSHALQSGGMHVPYRATLNPPLWEWGHIGWFQEWWIARNRQRSLGIDCEPGNERGPSLLEGADGLYDSSRVAHRSRWDLPLPGETATRAYLEATLAQTLGLLAALGEEPTDEELYFFRLVALHEEMHTEAAAYMARTLGIELRLPGPGARKASGGALAVPAQTFRLGYCGPGFAFDNELQPHDVRLQPFEIDAGPVSWSRFMPFVHADGYREQRWWTAEGWAWLRQEGVQPPAPDEAQAHEPAIHLSAHEAQAWCRWAGRRLPVEAEWECAALSAPGFQWGDVWEWTASPFEPYPGFRAHPYRDYSQPWFGSRRVLRGACYATSPALAHPRYRNFFEPHRRDIFAGFRSCA